MCYVNLNAFYKHTPEVKSNICTTILIIAGLPQAPCVIFSSLRTVDLPVDVWWGGMNQTHRKLSHDETGWSSWSCPMSSRSLRGRFVQLQTTPGERMKVLMRTQKQSRKRTDIFVVRTNTIMNHTVTVYGEGWRLRVRIMYVWFLPLSVSSPQAALCWGQSWPPACCSIASTSTRLLHPSSAQGASCYNKIMISFI